MGTLSFPQKGGPMTELEKIISRIDSFRDEMIDFQIQLCAIPAIAPASGGEGEVKKAEILLDFLKKLSPEYSRSLQGKGFFQDYMGHDTHGYRPSRRTGSVERRSF